MCTKMFINYMWANGVEPSEKDVKLFERMAKSYMQKEIEDLEDRLDKAHALLSDIREHGDYGSDWDEKITKLLVLD